MPPLRMLHLLVLMAVLCGADATCPADYNPLVLDPPEVIVEYEKEVSVNCTSSYEDHDGMYWSNEESEMTVDDKFIPWTGQLSAWNVTATCIIKMNDSFDCSKDLKITLYKNPDKVTLFSLNDPVVETEFVLQCDVHDAAPVQNLTVKWYKDNKMIWTDSFLNTSKTPVSESSLLTVNVSRGDNRAVFRCEAQLDFGPKWDKPPPISDTKVISVQYAPEFSNNTLDVDLMEGDNVTLSCDAEGNPPPHFHWTRDGVNMMENTKNLSVTQVNVSADYTCTASNPLGRTNKSIFIHVIKDVMRAPAVAVTTAVPLTVCPLTLTPGEVVVRFGDRASVNCSTSALDAAGMGWEASVRGTQFEKPPSVTWTVEKLRAWSIKPRCYITLRNNQQCSAVPNITLYKTPDAVSVSAETQGPMVEGVQYLLRCDIISVAPVRNLRVTWSMGEENYGEEMFNDTSATPVNKTSLLRVTPTREHNGKLFRCNAELHLGPKGPETIPTVSSKPYTAVVHYAPEFSNNTLDVDLMEGDDVTLSCDAEGNPPPHFHWTRDGVNMMENTKNLSVTQVNVSADYTCTASNPLGSTNKSIFIHVIKDVMRAPAVAVTTAVPRTVCPLTLTPGEVVVRFGDRASVNCSTSALDASGMGWEASVGGTQFEKPPSVNWTVEKLQAWSIKPRCYITLSNNQQCSAVPNITLYKTPDAVSVSAETQGPMVEGVQCLLRCDIISVAPVRNLRVTWSMGEENYGEEMFNDTSATPLNKTSLLRVTPTREHNGKLFRCNAELHLGPKGPETIPTVSSKPYTAVVHFAPEFRKGNYSREVTPGEDVTFACSAEGNPVPEIQWNFSTVENARVTTGGRQKNVSVTGATSTNAGVYVCVATNKVGSVSRSVTLRMKGRRGLNRIIWWLLILCFFIVILIVVVTLCKRRKKKHGQYSFIPAAKEGSDIPLTTTSGGDKA